MSRSKSRRRHGHGPAAPHEAAAAGDRTAPSRRAARPRPAPRPARSPVSLLAPLAVALLTAIAYANAPGNVIVHDDRFFYPSRGPLDGASIVGFFRRDVWGAAYAQVGRLDDAVLAYSRAIDAGLATTGHANLGRTYARMGRTEEAEREFELAAEAEKDPAAHHYRLGLLIERFHPERLGDAAAEYRRALQLRAGYSAAQEALRRVGGR